MKRGGGFVNEEVELLRDELEKANKLIGIKQIFQENFPDNSFDTVPLLELVKSIEKVKKLIKPNIIFTHYEKDLNIDHKLTYQATITAARPLANESVKKIYSFEILSSTEWSFPLEFSANVFFDISKTLEAKINAMKCYSSELCEAPHPRSLEGIKLNARIQGMRVGLAYAEAFKLVRSIE